VPEIKESYAPELNIVDVAAGDYAAVVRHNNNGLRLLVRSGSQEPTTGVEAVNQMSAPGSGRFRPVASNRGTPG